MRGAQVRFNVNQIPKGSKDIHAALVRQELIHAGAPEGFSMADVERSIEFNHVVFTWMEPVQIGDHPQPERVPAHLMRWEEEMP